MFPQKRTCLGGSRGGGGKRESRREGGRGEDQGKEESERERGGGIGGERINHDNKEDKIVAPCHNFILSLTYSRQNTHTCTQIRIPESLAPFTDCRLTL